MNSSPHNPGMRGYSMDSETNVVNECFAVVFSPRRATSRRQSDRFPENCVQVVATEAEAHAGANPAANLHAAKVVGPARSSEGFRLFYLVSWLD